MFKCLPEGIVSLSLSVTDAPLNEGKKSPFGRVCLALLIVFLWVQGGCKVVREGHGPTRLPATRNTEQLIIDQLADLYEMPKDNVWEDGKAYFLPEEHGIELLQVLQPGTDLGSIRVYKAAVWIMHWGPEKFPILVWAVGSESQPQLGVLAGPSEVASAFPIALGKLIFESSEARESLALLVGKMVTVFYGEKPPVRLRVASEGNCKWAEQAVARRGTGRRVAASCFSEDGVLEKIILAPRDKG